MIDPRHRRSLAAAAALFALAFTCSTAMAATGHRGAVITIKLPDVDRIELQRDTGGGLVYLVTYDDDHNEALSPEAFASLVSEKLNRQSWLEKICNISSPIGFIWVSVGLLGQVLFTGRLFVQWLASEREKRSVVPLAFWWMSLIGGALLLVYFIWRRDVVGFLGQLTGFTIYSRNLILIYARRREHAHAAAAGTSNAR